MNQALPRPSSRRRQRGMSIFEISLGTALMGLVIAYAMTINTRAGDQDAGRRDADSLSSFANMAAEYYTANRTAIDAAMRAGTLASTYCRLDVAADGTGGTTAYSSTLKTCAIDPTLLRARNLWPAGMSVEARGGRYVAIFRTIYDTQATPQPTGGVEVLIALAQTSGTLSPVTLNNRLTDEVQAGMTALGGVGGYVPIGTMGACKALRSSAAYEACGNGWKVNLANFVDAAQLTVFANALPN